jgi:2-phospho-L-lactate/phosphoenolpyruvate guanylyltransferase
MRYILIPVKDLTRAKQRLADCMTQEERTALARLMLEQTLAAVAGVRTVDRAAIVTLYPPAIALADQYGFEVIPETQQSSESASVDFGSREIVRRGGTTVLRLPIDLPLITPADIEAILQFENAETPVVLSPSRDGSGTNALLRRPPDLFPSHFGPNSLTRHHEESQRLKIRMSIVYMERLALDIDDASDLLYFSAHAGGAPIYDFLNQKRVFERLEPAARPSPG